jgi:hypothetical protein
MDEQKCCTKCGETKPVEEFYRKRKSLDANAGRYPWCRACFLAKHRAWYAKNRALVAANKHDIPQTKRCWKCHQVKSSFEFGRCAAYLGGLDPQCKSCAKEYAKTTGNPSKRLKDPAGRKANLWTMYRLRPEDYHALLQVQNHLCGVCEGELPKTPYIDHCHTSGKVRGLVCNTCNSGLGFLERPGFLDKAMKYLQRNS